MGTPAELQTFKSRTVAGALELHPNTIRSLIKAGELEVVWISKSDPRLTGKGLAKVKSGVTWDVLCNFCK
jgi:hypothetical protein